MKFKKKDQVEQLEDLEKTIPSLPVDSEGNLEVVHTHEPSVLTHTSLGAFKDEVTGKWFVAKIKYNPVTKETGELEELIAGSTRDEVIEKFKIEASNEDLVG